MSLLSLLGWIMLSPAKLWGQTPTAVPSEPEATTAQSAAPTPPAIRRWFDLQNAVLATRYRWMRSSDNRVTSNTHQWQPLLRGRFLFDRGGHYSIGFTAQSGSQFVSGWNNSGGGLGTFSGDFNLKHLFVAAEPVEGVELQVGGLAILHGESHEITSYDNDAFFVGERLTIRPSLAGLAEVSLSIGYLGDFRVPNVFRRLDRIDAINYGQLLVGLRLTPFATASVEYTNEDGRDILRQGLTLRMPASVARLTAVRVDAYQRVSDSAAQGINVAADVRVAVPFTVTAGVAHVDQFYVAPGYMSLNADRFERGTRLYSQGVYALTGDLAVGWFHGYAFATDYPIANQHRAELLLTFNPTATLKARRVF